MAFRDDREALRAKNEVLEGEVEGLRRDFERAQRELAEHEATGERGRAELARLRQQVAEYRRRLGLPDEPEEAAHTRRPVGALVAFAVLMPVLGLFLGSRLHVQEKVAVSPPRPPRVVVSPAPSMEPVRFGAEVRRAQGLALEPGDGCVITANLGLAAEVERVRVTCDELVYDSWMEGEAGTMRRSFVVEYRAPGDVYRYQLEHTDVGPRRGPRPQIQIDTGDRIAHVWREGGEAFDLQLAVADQSVPREAESLTRVPLRAESDAQLHVRARVRSTRGPHPEVGEACELRGRTDTGTSCRFVIRCGDSTLYGAGAGGYQEWCAGGDTLERFQAADDLGISSEDGDPRLIWHLSERRLTVEDGRGEEAWRVELTLEEDPRCSLEGRWAGWLSTEHGESSMMVRAEGEGEAPVVTTSRGVDVGRVVQLDCVRGEAAFLGSDGARYEGRFGPGFATFIGRVTGAPAGTFALHRER